MAETDGSLKIRVGLDTKEFKAGTKDLEAAARKTASKISDIGDKTKIALEKQLNAFTALNQQYARQEQKVEQLKQKLKELSGQKVETEEYKALNSEIKKTEMALDRAIEKEIRFTETGGNIKSRAFQAMEYDIEQLNAKLDEARAKKKALEESDSAYQKADNQDLVNTFQTRLGNEQEKLSQMGSRLTTSSSVLNSKLQELKEKEDAAAESADDLANSENRLTVVTNKLKQAASKAGGMIRKMATFAGKGIFAIRNLGGQSDQTRMSLGKMLATSLLFSTVFRALSLVTSGVQAGFTNLAQYSNYTNASISSLMTALTYLKNSFATAFAPILNVVAPLLTTFINMIARAVTYVGMFFAALTGQKSFQKAIPVQENFAAGLADTASNAQDAADGIKDAAEAANDYLSPLDEISRFETKKDSGSSGGSGGGGGSLPGYTPPSASEMFETVPIESAIQDFADKIKDLIAAQDWDGLGELLADKINGVFVVIKDAISWEKVGPQITYFVDAFTTTFNSLIYNIDWDLIGRTVGTGINTIVNTLYLLITGINWKLLGSSFAAGINGLADEVEWWNLGALLGQKFMIAWNMLYGFLTTLNWPEIGLAIANGMNGAIANIDLATVSSAISAFVIGLLTMITIAAQNTDWNAVGQTVADMLNSLDWAAFASQLYEAGKSIIDGLLTAFSELPMPVIVATSLILAFLAAVKMGPAMAAAVTAIQGVITAISDAGGLIAALKAVVAMIGGPTTIAIFAIVAVVAGAVALIVSHWDEVKAWMSGFLDWLHSLFLTDWTTVFGAAGNTINDFFSGVSLFFGGIKDIFSGLIDFLTGVFTGNWEQAWQGIVDIFDGFFNMIIGLAKTPINAVIDLINGMISAVESGLNWVIGGANKISFSIPDWVPGIGGNRFGINISPVSFDRVPRLATGAVIPPRSEFLAVLGDQKQGTNIETPEALLRQIMREELQGTKQNQNTSYRFTAQINRRVLFDEMMEEARIRQSQSGENPFEIA